MLENPENAVSNHPGAAHAAQFCVQQIESSGGTTGQTTILHTLTLLKDIIHTFPKGHIKVLLQLKYHKVKISYSEPISLNK